MGVFNAKDGRKFSSNTSKSDSEGNYIMIKNNIC
jgi:hypothetical protein